MKLQTAATIRLRSVVFDSHLYNLCLVFEIITHCCLIQRLVQDELTCARLHLKNDKYEKEKKLKKKKKKRDLTDYKNKEEFL